MKTPRIHWEECVANKGLTKQTGTENVTKSIKRQSQKWLGHIMKKKTRHSYAAMAVISRWKRKRGGPLGTWRCRIQEKLKKVRKTWYEVSQLAEDRVGWGTFVDVLCSTGDTED